MTNKKKVIIHLIALSVFGYLGLNNFSLAEYVLSIYALALFFETTTSVYCCLFFVLLLPFFVYNLKMEIAEHYAVSAYVFLSGAVIYALARQNEFLGNFFTIDYSQILYMVTGEKIFIKDHFSDNFNQKATAFIPLAIFAFLLLYPL